MDYALLDKIKEPLVKFKIKIEQNDEIYWKR